jgi:hypothetical protein
VDTTRWDLIALLKVFAEYCRLFSSGEALPSPDEFSATGPQCPLEASQDYYWSTSSCWKLAVWTDGGKEATKKHSSQIFTACPS